MTDLYQLTRQAFYGGFRHVMGEMGWTCDGHEPEPCGDCQKMYDETATAMLVMLGGLETATSVGRGETG